MRKGERTQDPTSIRLAYESQKELARIQQQLAEAAARAQAARRMQDTSERLRAESAALKAKLDAAKASKKMSGKPAPIRSLSVSQWDGSGYGMTASPTSPQNKSMRKVLERSPSSQRSNAIDA